MARIEEYTAPITLLRPDREGYGAFETAGRRLGPLYNDVAQALREAGAAEGRGIVNQARVTQLIAELANPVATVRAGGGGGGGGGSARERGNQPTRIADAADKLAGMARALATPVPQYQAMMPQGKDRFGSLIGKSLAQGGDTNLMPDQNVFDQSPESVARLRAYNARDAITGQYIGPPEYDTSGDYGGSGGPYADWGVNAGQPPVAGKIVWPTTVYGGDSSYPRITSRDDIMKEPTGSIWPSASGIYDLFSGIFGGNDYGGGGGGDASSIDYTGR